MKKFASVVLAFIFMLSLASCGNNSASNETTEKQTENVVDKTTASASENDIQSSGKTLVVYYSATGSTKSVAEKIAKKLNADIFEIEPKDPYSSDDLNWSDDNSRVSVEHNDESRRDVPLIKNTPDNWEQYDTVYVGYPIWWGIAAWPINGFVENNDFTGKTVIPFCTSASSGIGNSGELLKNAAGTGDWQSGERFSSGADENDIDEWLDNITD